MSIKVSIVEDSAIFRNKLSDLIDGTEDMKCVCTCETATQAIARIPKHTPDVVLMDIQLPDSSGIECTFQLKGLLPDTQIMIFTVHEDSDKIFTALENGAAGYLLKRTPPDEILASIRELHRGGAPMSSGIARKVVHYFSRKKTQNSDLQGLSPRQNEILRLLAQGCADKEIAAKLNISLDTIRSYLKLIYQKLHVHSRTEAVIKYLK